MKSSIIEATAAAATTTTTTKFPADVVVAFWRANEGNVINATSLTLSRLFFPSFPFLW